jgi:DNA replication protein DnaD
LDDQLKADLDQQDWPRIVQRLTLSALKYLRLCGHGGQGKDGTAAPSRRSPEDYALTAVEKVYEGCTTGKNKWNPNRGDLFPFLDALVHRFITDDQKKYTNRPATISYEADEVDVATDQATGELLNALFSDADDGTQELILALQEQVGSDGSMNWGEVQTTLNISKHELNKRRTNLQALLKKHNLY